MGIIYAFGILCLLGMPLFGLRWGSGRVVFLALVWFIAGSLARNCGAALADMWPLGDATASMNQGIWSLIVFGVLAVLGIPMSFWLHRLLPWTLDPFDGIIGMLLGIAAGVIVLHFVFIGVLHIADQTPLHATLSEHALVRQCVYLEGWHRFATWLSALHHPAPPPVIPEAP